MHENNISSKTEQELNGNLTSQTSILNKSFFKSIFYSQDKHGSLEKKWQTRAQLAPFLPATSTKQPRSKNLTPLHPGKFGLSLSGKVCLQTICYFLLSLWPGLNLAPTVVQPLSTFNETSTNADWSLVRQGSFAFMAPCPWTTNCQYLATVCHLHSANKQFFEIGKVFKCLKAFSALDDELSTGKWPKTQQFRAILTHFQGNSANDSADQKANSNVSSIVTWPTVMWHYTCITIPSPSMKKSFNTPPPLPF